MNKKEKIASNFWNVSRNAFPYLRKGGEFIWATSPWSHLLYNLEFALRVFFSQGNDVQRLLFSMQTSFGYVWSGRAGGLFDLKVTFVLFGLLGICRDCRSSVLEGPVASDDGIASTGMEEGAACAIPITAVESLLRALASVTVLWTIIQR